MKDEAEILALLSQRRAHYGPIHAKQHELAVAYDGENPMVTAELGMNEKPAVPNLINSGIDQLAMRVASTAAQPYFPAMRPGNRDSERYARLRRDVTLAWWDLNRLHIKARKSARDLIGFGAAPVVIRYDHKQGIPRWDLKDPKETFPAIGDPGDSVTPSDTIFTSRAPYWRLLKDYPDQIAKLRTGDRPKHDDLYELVHFLDDEQTRLIVIGKAAYGDSAYGMPASPTYGSAPYMTLELAANRIGMCQVVMPGRISLSKPYSTFMLIMGLYERQGRLMSMEEQAMFNSVFPKTFLQANAPGMQPKITTQADGRTGQVGVISDGTITTLNEQPNLSVLNAVDRGERAVRVTAGLPADFGGESASNVRTGRRGDSIVANTVDFTVQENQELLEIARMEEDRRAIALDKAYGGDRPKLVNVAWKGAKGPLTYIPTKHWETDVHSVRYALVGADAQQTDIAIAQRVGTDRMSRQTAMEMDSMVDDAELEQRRIMVEKFDRAATDAIASKMADGTIPLDDAAEIEEQVLAGKTWRDAYKAVQAKAQERQSTTVNPVPEGSPAAMPGLALPGAGAEAGTQVSPAVPAPPPSLDNLAAVLSRARQTTAA